MNNKVQQSIVLLVFTFTIASIFILTENNVFAIEYTNYTSEKYNIQFEYPSHWNLIEHTISGITYLVTYLSSDAARFSIFYNDAMNIFGTLNVEEATKKNFQMN